MAIKKIESCCCFDLKTGVLIICVLGILGNIGSIIQGPVAYSQACRGGRTVDNDSNCASASSMLAVTISSAVIGFILTSLTLYGSQKEKHQLMLPVIILQAIGLVIFFIAVWYLTIVAFIASVGAGFLFMIIGNAVVGIGVYLWLVLYSRCAEIRDASHPSGHA
ncbi:uncharacterized protein LOC130674350 [Microplitis mediator]|uniref:uncharacterized protein LOC130674350 n=1 Tax=Microplitis mediator TaxID=375433 RepID=UPI002553B497|nr:uncharacterized protein LOC130674350 [Microplitis mediator]